MLGPIEVPSIDTERLTLRAHRPADLKACAEMWADPLVTRFFGNKTLSEEDVWSRLLRYVGHWHWMGFGYWAIKEKVTGAFCGELGFADYKREIEPPLDGVPELGWIVAPRVQNQGYATEAVQAVQAWGDFNLPARRTVCIIHPDNAPSLRVAAKCGFRELHRATYKGEPTIVFSRD